MKFHRLAHEQPIWKLIAELCLAMFLVLILVVIGISIVDSESTLGDVYALAFAIPAPFIAARIMGRDPAALVSVVKRVRWDIVGKAAVIALPPYAVWLAISAADGEAQFTRATLSLLAVFVLITPLQAATEEVMFRAALPQLVGARVRSPWLVYGIAMLPFVFMHLYNWMGLLDILMFAACASYLTWRTGGIEAAVVLHAANNIMVFGGEALHPGRAPIVDVPLGLAAVSSAVTIAVTALLALRLRPQSRSLPSPQ